MRTFSSPSLHRARPSCGFTLVELMITLAILGVVMVVLSTIIYSAARSKTQTANNMESSQLTRVAVDMIARDLRNAGFHADRDNPTPQQPIAYVDSMQVLIAADLDATPVTGPQAYDPARNPKPFPLAGTAYAPPVKYGTGAELIRWTLDTNNDGQVDSGDIDDANGVDARRTRNPNDYELVREVYGDSTGGVAGNGGAVERISLLKRPSTGDVPALFTVYLFGDPNPWPWSNGPIPVGRLKDIERIVIRAVGTSPKPNWRGQYASTEYRTEVTVTRNVPNFGDEEYAVDGRVYVDQNSNGVFDAGTDLGVPGSQVILSSFTTHTDSTGYFLLHAPAGTYTLRHVPPAGYQNATLPDSFVVTIGPPQTRQFRDTKTAGGRVGIFAYEDQNKNGVFDAGEPPMQGVGVVLTQTGESQYTSPYGKAQLFAPVGAFTVSGTPPTGYVITGTNPYSGTMVDGGADSVVFGLTDTPTGTIAGKVFVDVNRNGVWDSGENGVNKVWVGATMNGGLTVVGSQYTDANGDYTITVPANDPPATDPYTVTFIMPNGFYPTGPTSLGGIFVQAGQNVTGKNFGVASFQVITLNASRVLSLGNADLVEQDWNGTDAQWDTKGHQDKDIVLGADAGGTDNISVWFNNYNGSPLFDPNPTYTRNAPSSVLALRLEMLDKEVPTSRYDAITGTRYTTSGNFFVWFAQNTSGNLGYFSATQDQSYTTADKGDVQAVMTADVGGGTSPDIIVGTRSPTAGQGHIETWINDEGTVPTFTRDEIYPPQGSISGSNLGEVTCMAMADLDKDGDPDLVVGTRTGDYTGQLIVFENTGRAPGARFKEVLHEDLPDESITALSLIDMNGDGLLDIITGSEESATSGRLEQWMNTGSLDFSLTRKVASGIVMSMCAVDLGGLPRKDLVVGIRDTDPGYAGGIRIYFTDLGYIPPYGTDPSNGTITYMVPALTSANFNYGVNPSLPAPPYLDDVAAGIKTGPSTGALVVFIR